MTYKKYPTSFVIKKIIGVSRSKSAPLYWVPFGVFYKNKHARFYDEISLVFASKNIPYAYSINRIKSLYLPAIYSNLAQKELYEYLLEKPPLPKITLSKLSLHLNFILILFLFVLFCYSFTNGSSFSRILSVIPANFNWNLNFGLISNKVLQDNEWWRCVTALFVHFDGEHVVSNCLFGFLFSIPLFIRVGPGGGIFLIIAGGVIGNIISVFVRRGDILSVGFSGALFAIIGALVGISICFDYLFSYGSYECSLNNRLQKSLPAPLIFFIAGLCILVFLGLGEEGKNIDVLGHLFGFLGGLLVAMPYSYLVFRYESFIKSLKFQYSLYTFVFIFIITCLIFGFCKIL